MKSVIVVGAGPGGLATALLLSAKGYQVSVLEKAHTIGGRSKRLHVGDFKFDSGPTFLMQIDILKKVFAGASVAIEDVLTLERLNPLYALIFPDKRFILKDNVDDNAKILESHYPGSGDAYKKFMHDQAKIFDKVSPILQKPFMSRLNFFRKDILSGFPYLHPLQSVADRLKRYFKDEQLIHALSFQSKYLGMSPYKAPAVFTILAYMEHAFGLYHVKGGLNRINHAFAKAIQQRDGTIETNTGVKKLLVENKKAIGVELDDGTTRHADTIVIGADFAHFMKHHVDEDNRKNYSNKRIDNYDVSLSAFMMYLGLDKIYDAPHHTIVFSKDYKTYVKNVAEENTLPDDLSVYIHNPTPRDDTLAPKGKSGLYILVPVPNVKSSIDWEERKISLKEQTLDLIESRTEYKDLRNHIIEEKLLTPKDWQDDYYVHAGAVFNLSHRFGQMLHKRPPNQFKSIQNVYLVGGGTHPGSGLPTIYQSSLIAAELIDKNQ